MKVNNLGCYFEKGIRFNQDLRTGQKSGIPIARLKIAGSKEAPFAPQTHQSNRQPLQRKINRRLSFLHVKSFLLIHSPVFFFFRRIINVETPNQIAAWMSPPNSASRGVDMVPPAAITIPTTKPMRAQNLGFEVFIT